MLHAKLWEIAELDLQLGAGSTNKAALPLSVLFNILRQGQPALHAVRAKLHRRDSQAAPEPLGPVLLHSARGLALAL